MIDFYVCEAIFERDLSRYIQMDHLCNSNLICFVLSGCGTINGLKLKMGNGFICAKGDTFDYNYDSSSPWNLFCIRFLPEERIDFPFESNTFTFERTNLFNRTMNFLRLQNDNLLSNRSLAVSCFLLICHCISVYQTLDTLTIQQQYVQQVKKYIDDNYHKKLSIDSISKEFNISRAYLRNLFFAEEGNSPKQYLIEVRIKHAKRLLESFSFSIADVARSVGYDDEFQFSKMFKKYTGISPSAYRENEFLLSKEEYGDFIYFWQPSRYR